MSTYINCLYFASSILDLFVTVLKIVFNYEVISSNFYRRLMLFFLRKKFPVIKDFSYGDIEYIINMTTLIITISTLIIKYINLDNYY